MVSGFDTLGPEYEKRVRELFDFATVGWYWWNDEATADKGDFVNYERMDASVQWCLDRKITPKNFGYLYMARGATPEWIRPNELPATTRAARDGVSRAPARADQHAAQQRAVQRQARVQRQVAVRPREEDLRAGHPPDDAALPRPRAVRRDHERGARQGEPLGPEPRADPRHGEDGVHRRARGLADRAAHDEPLLHVGRVREEPQRATARRRWSPHQFIKTCFDNGIDYEVIGLQLYYPQHDVFEIDRMLDRFNEFNKPIHITEIATASPGRPRPRAHAPEDLRARLARPVEPDAAGRLGGGDVDAALQQAELPGRRLVGFRRRRAATSGPSADCYRRTCSRRKRITAC